MYLMFSKLLAWTALSIRSDTTKEIEIFVLVGFQNSANAVICPIMPLVGTC